MHTKIVAAILILGLGGRFSMAQDAVRVGAPRISIEVDIGGPTILPSVTAQFAVHNFGNCQLGFRTGIGGIPETRFGPISLDNALIFPASLSFVAGPNKHKFDGGIGTTIASFDGGKSYEVLAHTWIGVRYQRPDSPWYYRLSGTAFGSRYKTIRQGEPVVEYEGYRMYGFAIGRQLLAPKSSNTDSDRTHSRFWNATKRESGLAAWGQVRESLFEGAASVGWLFRESAYLGIMAAHLHQQELQMLGVSYRMYMHQRPTKFYMGMSSGWARAYNSYSYYGNGPFWEPEIGISFPTAWRVRLEAGLSLGMCNIGYRTGNWDYYTGLRVETTTRETIATGSINFGFSLL